MTSKSYNDNYFGGLVLLDSLLYSLSILFSRGYCMIFEKINGLLLNQRASVAWNTLSDISCSVCLHAQMCLCLHMKQHILESFPSFKK